MHNFRELNIWKKAMNLAKVVITEAQDFPENQKHGISSQICRAAVSIPSNIAEGSGRTSDKEFSRYLDIAKGSSYELETQLMLSLELNFIQKEKFDIILNQLNELQKMLRGFQKTLN